GGGQLRRDVRAQHRPDRHRARNERAMARRRTDVRTADPLARARHFDTSPHSARPAGGGGPAWAGALPAARETSAMHEAARDGLSVRKATPRTRVTCTATSPATARALRPRAPS